MCACGKRSMIDRSSSIFFPPQLRDEVLASQQFPTFWWNFVVIEGVRAQDAGAWSTLVATCAALKRLPKAFVKTVGCEHDVADFLPAARAWARDYPLRHPLPDVETLRTHMDRVLVQASLPGFQGPLLDVLRNDPLGSWKTLRAYAEARMPLRFPRHNGFFYDSATQRVLIPLQMAFAPPETARTRKVMTQLAGAVRQPHLLIGPHASTLHNETRILADTEIVSRIGMAALLLLSLVLLWIGAARAILLLGFVFLGTGLSFVVTRAVFGSVHGLTLSFGTAIIGLALDYALQAAFNIKTRSIWRSNFCGFSTTVVGLVVLMTSTIPLLRQMMFFGALGLTLSFILLYLYLAKWGKWKHLDVRVYTPRKRPAMAALSVALAVVSLVGLAVVRPQLDMQRFDFQPERARKIGRWFFSSMRMPPPLFQIDAQDTALQASQMARTWADSAHIPLETVSNYVPTLAQQTQHLASLERKRTSVIRQLSATHQTFFFPFIQNMTRRPYTLTLPVRPYCEHLQGDGQWLTLWMPRDAAQERKIQQHFPRVTSLRAVFARFPKILGQELHWMAPLSCLLATLFHFIYYRRLSYALIALFPFFCGMGLVMAVSFAFGFELSFVSVIGLVLVFGFSLDYGIFATDACLNPTREHMWTAIAVAALATLAGFVPLAFCKHPVLRDLGWTLLLGGAGTYLGAAYGIPWLMRRPRRTLDKTDLHRASQY